MTIQINNSSVVQAGSQERKGPSYPTASYLSTIGEWKRNRAIINGQSYTKDYDRTPDVNSNILIPFNPTMTPDQYSFYKAEAELPGIVSQYVKTIIGGLLRKQPLLELPEGYNEGAKNWILSNFGANNESLISFLDGALKEELSTSRAWVQVDYPAIDLNTLSPEDREKVSPYPILWKAENVINWSQSTNRLTGEQRLSRVITRYYGTQFTEESPFHPRYRDTVDVHFIDSEGNYSIATYIKGESATPTFIDGSIDFNFINEDSTFQLVGINENLFIDGKRMDFIPFYPLNGSVEIVDPIMTTLVDREIGLYNKISRRNHLLYLAATYTPVVTSDSLGDDEKAELVKNGLGTWMFLGKEDAIEVLQAPSDALKDLEAAIINGYNEITRLGIKMLSLEPTNNASSGVALEIRNASQNAQLSTLNARISESMKRVIVTMLNWRYATELTEDEVSFSLSADFNPVAIGAEWMRLVTEWYANGYIPREEFIKIAKQNDLLADDYNDEEGREAMSQDETIVTPIRTFESEMRAIGEEGRNRLPNAE